MSVSQSVNPSKSASVQEVGDAVGVSHPCWFVAIVGNNTERASGEKLSRMGYENYVPTQTETRLWRNGKCHDVERIVFPAMVFVRTTESGRREVVNFPFIKRFLTDRAGTPDAFNKHPVAVVPDEQIARLRFMLEHADGAVTFDASRVRLGDKVRVVKGALRGFEGHISQMADGITFLVVQIDQLGCAKLTIPQEWVEKV